MNAWPDPRANALDRARAIARTYRDALARVHPVSARQIDEAAQDVGEGWVCGTTTTKHSCTVRQAAILLGVTDRRVRQLIADGTIRSSGKATDGHVLWVDDVLAYRTERDAARRRGA